MADPASVRMAFADIDATQAVDPQAIPVVLDLHPTAPQQSEVFLNGQRTNQVMGLTVTANVHETILTVEEMVTPHQVDWETLQPATIRIEGYFVGREMARIYGNPMEILAFKEFHERFREKQLELERLCHQLRVTQAKLNKFIKEIADGEGRNT